MIDTGDQRRIGLRGRDLFGKLYRQSPTVPLNRVVMPSYITLKANKIAAIRTGDMYMYIYIYVGIDIEASGGLGIEKTR